MTTASPGRTSRSSSARRTPSGSSIARAIEATLSSPNEMDSNGEIANVTDGLYALARAVHHLADALEHRREPEESW